MKFGLLLVIILLLVLLTKYYSVLIHRAVQVLSPILLPVIKKLNAKLLNFDEKIAGTKRKAKAAPRGNPDRYVEVENPYKRVSVTLAAMVASVLTLYINQTIGIFLISFFTVSLCCDIIFLPFRRKAEKTKAGRIFSSCILQLAAALVITVLFRKEIQNLIVDLLSRLK